VSDDFALIDDSSDQAELSPLARVVIVLEVAVSPFPGPRTRAAQKAMFGAVRAVITATS
jgi:hypothetical protein